MDKFVLELTDEEVETARIISDKYLNYNVGFNLKKETKNVLKKVLISTK